MRYLGRLYEEVRSVMQRGVIASEMAGRCAKAVLRKTLQDAILEEHAWMGDNDVRAKTLDLLNCLLGNTAETASLWRLLSAHSLNYFGV